MDNTKLANDIATRCYAKFLAQHYDNDPENGIFDIENAIYDAALAAAEAKDKEFAGEAKMTLAAKYASNASKSLKSQLLEAVEAKLKKMEEGWTFSFTIGWFNSGYENVLKTQEPSNLCPMDAITHEGSHEEINSIMKAEGFKAIEDYGGYHHRARTTYVLER